MIEFKLKEIMNKKGITRYQLAKDININYQTLTKLYYGQNKKLQYDILNKICLYFNCTPGDLIVYTPDPDVISPREFIENLATSDSEEIKELREKIYKDYYYKYQKSEGRCRHESLS